MGKRLEKAADRLMLPSEALGGVKLTLTGGTQVLIENHKGLLEYGDELITVSCGRQMVRVRGEGLSLMAMNSTSLIIKGQILGIDME